MRTFCIIFFFLFVNILFAQEQNDNEAYKGLKRKQSREGAKAKKKSSEIDLEAIDIQGLIDRPQTLYILKKSKINFYDTIDENDYVRSIIESTYKSPF